MRANVTLDFAVVSLTRSTLRLGKIIAEARRRGDAEEYGDTATIGNRPVPIKDHGRAVSECFVNPP